MKAVHIRASPKQLSKLRNGHKVRIAKAVEGEGFNLLVNPASYNHITKTFSKDKGTMIQLSPDELRANMSVAGNGIFSTLKKGASKVMSNPIVKDLAKKGVDLAVKSAGSSGYVPPELASALGSVAKQQIGSGFMDTLKKGAKAVASSKIAKDIAKKGVDLAVKSAGSSGYVNPAVASALGNIAKDQIGSGLYAGARRGMGVCGRGALMNVHNRALPPALQSQNLSANFHFATQLPPALAQIKYM